MVGVKQLTSSVQRALVALDNSNNLIDWVPRVCPAPFFSNF